MPPSVSSKRPNLNFVASVHRNQKLNKNIWDKLVRVTVSQSHLVLVPVRHQLMQTYRYRPLQQAAVVPEKGKKPSGGKKKAGKKIALLTLDRVWNHENNIRKCPNSSFTFIS